MIDEFVEAAAVATITVVDAAVTAIVPGGAVVKLAVEAAVDLAAGGGVITTKAGMIAIPAARAAPTAAKATLTHIAKNAPVIKTAVGLGMTLWNLGQGIGKAIDFYKCRHPGD